MILVTGATGNVGSQIVHQLLAQGQKVRAFTRDAAKIAPWNGRVQVALGDFTHPDTFASAVAGVKGVFLMNGALDDELFRQLVAIARERGVRRIVFLSSQLAADPASPIGRLHKGKEDALLASGLEVAIIRAGSFMSNTNQWVGSIKSQGLVYDPTGNGPVAPIHPADIAAVAVHALTAPKLSETLFEVTGDKPLTTAERVDILAKVLGRPLRVVEVTAEAAVEGLVKNGIPPHVAQALGASFAAIRDGHAATVTDTVERVTGQKPRSYESWVREHAAQFA
ncbi:MAG TPA: NAD(P)H-binding protein [Acidobacteriaceae bacterium]|nr:NAD(P)H-binding protein [Acidobacteriaceae bacterium]